MRILFSIIILMLSIVVKSQDPLNSGFLDSTYMWTEYHQYFWGGALSYRYTIDSKPTTVFGKDYYGVLRNSDENSDWTTDGYIRFENNIVYTPGDYPLYDFNLMVGDTFFEGYYSPLVVDSIDTILLLNGEERKRWKLRCTEDSPGEYPYTEWIEGIGNIDGLYAINGASNCVADTDGSDIMCLSRNDTLLYDDPAYDSCWIPLVVRPIEGFLNSSNTWVEAYYDPFSPDIWSRKYTIDSLTTFLGGISYYELLQTDSEHSTDWVGTGNYIRTTNNVVVGFSGGFEHVLYNFNLDEGDYFYLSYLQHPKLLVVVEVDSVLLLNGEKRKWLKLRCSEADPGSDYFLEWIEGIGNINGLYANETMCLIDAAASTTLCVFQNDTLIYDDPDEEGCWLMVTSTNVINEVEIAIVPNPVTDFLEVSGYQSQIHSITVLNLLGIPVDQIEGDRINLKHLPAGYYYAMIVLNDNHTLTKAFVKR